ncbi:MAG TPA: phosphoribosylanthranilate isomerase [Terriglobales bacterium]|jgi:phosphoribosylanthranilate isomerase
MTWIKICGMTNLEDALATANAGPNAVGFVFYDKSPRNIDPQTAKSIVSKLPPRLEKVGVFVHGANAGMEKIAREVGLTGVQVHADPSVNGHPPEPQLPPQFKRYVALPGKLFFGEKGDGLKWFLPRGRRIDAIFLDSSTERLPGGTGEVFDWKQAAPTVGLLNRMIPIVVAGGLNAENVGEAIHTLSPWGVDVSSGVEASPGKKDPEKVRAFIQAVRNIENN